MMSNSINWSDPSQKISKYFSVGEVTQGKANRIPKDPEVIERILVLAQHLDLVREAWGHPIKVTSWYRPKLVNQAVGGARNSQHILGSAADIYPLAGGDIHSFQRWLENRWKGSVGRGAKKGFVHLDLRGIEGFGQKVNPWNY
jgi:putative chitinase